MKQFRQKTPAASIDVKSRMVMVRGEAALLDRDVASLYQIDTKVLNQAVKRNRERFPEGYIVQMSEGEFPNWKSQIDDLQFV